jgi:LacI family transcriptional regulator
MDYNIPMKLITIKDIAKKMGISHSTVSRSINDDPQISKATRDRVKKIINEMHYYPNAVARGLARARSNTIAVVTPSFFSPFSVEIMRGIEPEIIRSRYEMNYLSPRRYLDANSWGLDSILYERILNEKKAAAIIIISGNLYGGKNIIGRYRKAGIHVVFIEGGDKWGHRVRYDNEAAADMAVKHLISRNRKKIGLMVGNDRVVESMKERRHGFVKAMRRNGRVADENNMFVFYEDSPDIQRVALDFFIKNKVDAIYVASGDSDAQRLLDEAEKSGIKVPDDIAIISQDDMATASVVKLTAVRQPIVEMGKKAIELAVSAIETNNKKNMRDEIFYPELVVRKTT